MLRIFTSLLLGVALSLGIAYFAAVRRDPGRFVVSVKTAEALPARLRGRVRVEHVAFASAGCKSFGRVYEEYYACSHSYNGFLGERIECDPIAEADVFSSAFVEFAQYLRNESPTTPESQIVVDVFSIVSPGHYGRVTVGWPMPAFEGIVVRELVSGGCSGPQVTAETKHYFKDTSRTYAPNNMLGSIPYAPLPTGILTNVAFFAGCVWLVMFGMIDARKLWRVRRGRCPRCAYPIGVSPVCTECGRKLPERTVQRITAQTSANPGPS